MLRSMILAFIVAAAAAVSLPTSTATACGDSYQAGYFNGVGLAVGFGRTTTAYGAPPYFALYPPVYYDQTIIRRPYGISPFAAPPGVLPAEMLVAPQPARIVNPYFHDDRPQRDEDQPDPDA